MRIDSLITDGWTTDRVACEKVAEILTQSDPDWAYTVILNSRNDQYEKLYCIRITDEDGRHVQDVIPRKSL